ncbi:MAG: hypothetical protein LBT44_07745 [Clostridiales bacterium]|jgi:alpha-galactosidase|nr:hypothetical protein [Clostridiales bacterium]
MSVVKISEFFCKDMILRYTRDEKTRAVGLSMFPAALAGKARAEANDLLIHLKMAGDGYPARRQGRTLRGSETALRMRFERQKILPDTDGRTIITIFSDGLGHAAEHYAVTREGEPYVEFWTVFKNMSPQAADLELLTSFSISVSASGGEMFLHRYHGAWRKESLASLESLEPIRFGSIGSRSGDGWFPFAALEAGQSQCFWACSLECDSSWQMEMDCPDNCPADNRPGDRPVCLSGGMADREFGHWLKRIEPDGSFETPHAYGTVCVGTIDGAAQRLLRAQTRGWRNLENCPVVYSAPCDDLASVREAADKLKNRGIDCFMLEAGDWNVGGQTIRSWFQEAAFTLQERGFALGAGFAFEECAVESDACPKEWRLTRDGVVLRAGSRVFLDFRKPEAGDFMVETITRFLRENKCAYLKADCEETIGIGCDGAESLGEGLRVYREAVKNFYQRIRQAAPETDLEICHATDHPAVAADRARLIPARANWVWAAPRPGEPEGRAYYALASGFYGRMCLSGDILQLTEWQHARIDEALALYRKVFHVIRDGETQYINRRGAPPRQGAPPRWGEQNPSGWQALLRRTEGEALVLVHTFGGETPDSVILTLEGRWKLEGGFYRKTITPDAIARESRTKIRVAGLKRYDGVALYFKTTISILPAQSAQ